MVVLTIDCVDIEQRASADWRMYSLTLLCLGIVFSLFMYICLSSHTHIHNCACAVILVFVCVYSPHAHLICPRNFLELLFGFLRGYLGFVELVRVELLTQVAVCFAN